MRRGHDIKGVVTTSIGRPAANVRIEAVPSDPTAQYKEGMTDAEGKFVLEGLPAGDIALRAHSFLLEQKARVSVRLAEANIVQDLKLQPVAMKGPLSLVNVLGMRVADITPELKAAYDLEEHAQGVLIVHPGPNIERLGIGEAEEGEYIWMIGQKQIANVREMVDELLRINELEPPPEGRSAEGHRGSVRLVYSNHHWSRTQHIELTESDEAELKKLAAVLRKNAAR